jgi:hypothetical protein
MSDHCDICDRVRSDVRRGVVLDMYKKEKLDGFYYACDKCATYYENLHTRMRKLGGGGSAGQLAQRYLMVMQDINKARKRKRR